MRKYQHKDQELFGRRLAERKGCELRRVHDDMDCWHILNPKIDGTIYSVSLSHPHSFKLKEAMRYLRSKPDQSV